MQKRKRTKAVVIITVLLCYIGLVATKSLPGSHLVDRTAHVQNERELIAALRDEEVAQVELVANLTLTRRAWRGKTPLARQHAGGIAMA